MAVAVAEGRIYMGRLLNFNRVERGVGLGRISEGGKFWGGKSRF